MYQIWRESNETIIIYGSNHEVLDECYETFIEMSTSVNEIYMNFSQILQFFYFKLVESFYDSMQNFRFFRTH